MNLELSDDQILFVETTRRFCTDETPLTHLRSRHGDGLGFDPDAWRTGASLGWTAALVPDALGGGSVSGSGLRDLALVAEELGRVVSSAPLIPVSIVLDALARFGSSEQQTVVVPSLLSGDEIATWAFAEHARRCDIGSIATQATATADGWVIEGTKRFVQEAATARWFLVSARTEEGLSQFLVPSDATGVTVTEREALDLGQRFADIDFSGVEVGADALVGETGTATDQIERQLHLAVILQNAEVAGMLDTVFAMTLAYAHDRVAFGRPLASYQALKHRFADMKMWIEAAHATVSASTAAAADDASDAAELVAVAASFLKDKAPAIVQDCIQLHGGIGVTWEHDLHLYLRRVTQHATLYGDVTHHRDRLAALIGPATPTDGAANR